VSEPRLLDVHCLNGTSLHRMAYWEWGDPANHTVLVCLHGLTRQGRDFDTLARAVLDRYRVVCPDVVGRGRSDWLRNPMGYVLPQYVSDMVALLARLKADTVHWLGTSMGGLIGLGVAALGGSPVSKLVLNDVGPRLDPAGLARIGGYVGQTRRWQTLDEAADALWAISTGFGPHTREQWLTLTEPQLKTEGDALVPRSDPDIAVPFKAITPELAAAGEALVALEEEAAAHDARCARNGPAFGRLALIGAVRQLAALRSEHQRATRRSVPLASNSTIPSATPRSSTRGHSSANRPRSSVRSARIARSRAR